MAPSAPGQIREDLGRLKEAVENQGDKLDSLVARLDARDQRAADEREQLRRTVEDLKAQQGMLLPQAVANAAQAMDRVERLEPRVGALELSDAGKAVVNAGARLTSLEEFRAEQIASQKRWRWLGAGLIALAVAAGWVVNQFLSLLDLIERLRPPAPPGPH